MKRNTFVIDKEYYEKYLSAESFKENFISITPIPKITKKEVRLIKSGFKTFYSLQSTSPHSHIQNRLNNYFFSKIPLNSAAKAYVKGESYLSYLEPHIYGSSFCRLDIKSFFNNISFTDVKKSLSPYVKDEFLIGKEQTVLEAILNSVGYDDEKYDRTLIPMGFKTSPVISNIIFRKMDILIQDFCIKKGLIYSRYADDMLFSNLRDGNLLLSNYFFDEISSLISIMGFKLNESKYIAKKRMISVNGYVLENKGGRGVVGNIRLSSEKLSTINKVIHALNSKIPYKTICKRYLDIKLKDGDYKYESKREDFERKYYRDQLINFMNGYRAYLISIIKFNSDYNCMSIKFIESVNLTLNEIQVRIREIIKKRI
ncbi:RNA-directed DNA polymerase [Dickeya zeae]|uniref:RNA-directed DNA polymerase n=1 Tax=Dickeya zeae TaxID=204042 RepID=A0AAE7CZX6_9GAMM|nr:reverse transcriptase family protein [Dickeya zeae]QIZ52237.1 RNA-directed DNA polymerase [Dickeya zeae]